jgi:hypothetical protein
MASKAPRNRHSFPPRGEARGPDPGRPGRPPLGLCGLHAWLRRIRASGCLHFALSCLCETPPCARHSTMTLSPDSLAETFPRPCRACLMTACARQSQTHAARRPRVPAVRVSQRDPGVTHLLRNPRCARVRVTVRPHAPRAHVPRGGTAKGLAEARRGADQRLAPRRVA